jgi:hypothetical protein
MIAIVHLRSDNSVEDIAYLSWDNCYWVYFFYIFESQNKTGGILRISMRGWLSAVLSALNISVNEYSWQVLMHMHVYDVFYRRD